MDPIIFISPSDCEVHGVETPGWYFYSETWSEIYGPYDTREEASKAISRYALEVLEGVVDEFGTR